MIKNMTTLATMIQKKTTRTKMIISMSGKVITTTTAQPIPPATTGKKNGRKIHGENL